MNSAAIDLLQGRTFNVVTIILAIAGLAIASVSVYYGRASLFPPRRRISVSIGHPTSLLSDASAAISGIEVTHRQQVLADPRIIEITLENTGRHDISGLARVCPTALPVRWALWWWRRWRSESP
jgi:hypothetical protein